MPLKRTVTIRTLSDGRQLQWSRLNNSLSFIGAGWSEGTREGVIQFIKDSIVFDRKHGLDEYLHPQLCDIDPELSDRNDTTTFYKVKHPDRLEPTDATNLMLLVAEMLSDTPSADWTFDALNAARNSTVTPSEE